MLVVQGSTWAETENVELRMRLARPETIMNDPLLSVSTLPNDQFCHKIPTFHVVWSIEEKLDRERNWA